MVIETSLHSTTLVFLNYHKLSHSFILLSAIYCDGMALNNPFEIFLTMVLW